MKKDMKDNMAHYLKSFMRQDAIWVFVVAICLSAIIGAFCGRLLTQKERTTAELNIAKAEETLKSVNATRDELKREYTRLTDSRQNNSPQTYYTPSPKYKDERDRRWDNPADRELNPKFYDPDRTPPYMANEISQHHTRQGAINALAEQFGQTPSWVERHMGTTNDLLQIHYNLSMALLTSQSTFQNPKMQDQEKPSSFNTGKVHYSLVNTVRKSWQEEGWRYKSKGEQAQALALIILVVQADCSDPKDREATLDYIENNINQW